MASALTMSMPPGTNDADTLAWPDVWGAFAEPAGDSFPDFAPWTYSLSSLRSDEAISANGASMQFDSTSPTTYGSDSFVAPQTPLSSPDIPSNYAYLPNYSHLSNHPHLSAHSSASHATHLQAAADLLNGYAVSAPVLCMPHLSPALVAHLADYCASISHVAMLKEKLQSPAGHDFLSTSQQILSQVVSPSILPMQAPQEMAISRAFTPSQLVHGQNNPFALPLQPPSAVLTHLLPSQHTESAVSDSSTQIPAFFTPRHFAMAFDQAKIVSLVQNAGASQAAKGPEIRPVTNHHAAHHPSASINSNTQSTKSISPRNPLSCHDSCSSSRKEPSRPRRKSAPRGSKVPADRKAINPYIAFTLITRRERLRTDPFIGNRELVREIGRLWNDMPSDQKAVYAQIATNMTNDRSAFSHLLNQTI